MPSNSEKEIEPVKKEFDLALIQERFEASATAIKRAEGKKLILIATVTGNGASCLYNAVNGIPLERDVQGRIHVAKIAKRLYKDSVPGGQYSEIGHGGLSKTSIIHTSEIDKDIVLVDTPGFFDTRSESQEIEATKYLSLQMVLRGSKEGINALIVPLDANVLYTLRGAGLFQFAKKLSNLFCPEKVEKLEDLDNFLKFNTIFAFRGQQTLKQIKNQLKDLRKDRVASLHYRRGEEAAAEDRAILGVIDAMLAGKRTKFDVLNSESCKREILSFVQGAPVHDKSCFPLVRERQHFDVGLQFTGQVSELYLNLIKEKEDLESKILDSEKEDIRLIEKKEEYERSLVKKDYLNSEYIIKLYQDEIEDTKSQLASLENKQKKISQDIKSQREKIVNLKNDKTEEEVFNEWYCERTVCVVEKGGPEVKKGVVNKHTFLCEGDNSLFDYDVKPGLLLKNTVVEEGTEAYYKEMQKTKDRVEVIYHTPSHYYGTARCTVTAQRCDLLPSMKSIKNYQESILTLELESGALSSEIAEISDKIDDLENKFKIESDSAECKLKKELSKVKDAIKENSELSYLLKKKLSCVEDQIISNENKFSFLKTVIQNVIGKPWPESLEDRFLKKYLGDSPIPYPECLRFNSRDPSQSCDWGISDYNSEDEKDGDDEKDNQDNLNNRRYR